MLTSPPAAVQPHCSINEKLWSIFTHYSLSGTKSDPEHLNVRTSRPALCTYCCLAALFYPGRELTRFLQNGQFEKLLGDCGLIEDGTFRRSDVALIFTASTKNMSVNKGKDGNVGKKLDPRLDYEGFLAALMGLALKVERRCNGVLLSLTNPSGSETSSRLSVQNGRGNSAQLRKQAPHRVPRRRPVAWKSLWVT